MLIDYFRIGENELWNSARLQAYLTNVGSPFTTGASICACETLTPAMIGEPDGVYTTPADDPAPWYDADLPVSGEFLGMMVLDVQGIDGSTRTRNVTNAVGGGGVFGPLRDLPRTMTVSGVLIGTSCCGADYGLHWLAEALAGCSGSVCGGDCVTVYDGCPPQDTTPEEFETEHKRTFVRTALVSGPTVTGRRGTGSCQRGTCTLGGDLIEVEIVLVAASSTPWTEPVPLLDVNLPIGGTGDCIEWCLSPGGCALTDCAHRNCAPDPSLCADPLLTIPQPPQPSLPAAGFCVPLGVETACYPIDLTARPSWSSDMPIVTITSGSAPLRNVRVVIYERPGSLAAATCEEVAANQACSPNNEFYVTYIPASSAVTFDGRTGFATTECRGRCENSTTAYGDEDGGPVEFNELNCAMYCLCIETDATQPPATDAAVSFSVAGRGY